MNTRITVFAAGFLALVFDIPTIIVLSMGFDRSWAGLLMPALFLLWGWFFAILSDIVAEGQMPRLRDLPLVLLLLVAGFLFGKAFEAILEGLRLTWQAYRGVFILLLVMLLGAGYMFRSFFPTLKRFLSFLLGLLGLAILFSVWTPAKSLQPGLAGYCVGFLMTILMRSYSGYRAKIS